MTLHGLTESRSYLVLVKLLVNLSLLWQLYILMHEMSNLLLWLLDQYNNKPPQKLYGLKYISYIIPYKEGVKHFVVIIFMVMFVLEYHAVRIKLCLMFSVLLLDATDRAQEDCLPFPQFITRSPGFVQESIVSFGDPIVHRSQGKGGGGGGGLEVGHPNITEISPPSQTKQSIITNM